MSPSALRPEHVGRSWRGRVSRLLGLSATRRGWRRTCALRERAVLVMEALEDRTLLATYLSVSDPAPVLEGDTGTTNLVFVVTRSGDTSEGQSVSYTTVDGTAHAGVDYVATSGTLAFAVGQTTATVPVPVIGNTLAQPDRTLELILTNPSNPAASLVPQTFDTADSSHPFGVAVGDINGDGKPDIVVTNSGSVPNIGSVLLNTTAPGAAAPTFAVRQTFALGNGSAALSLGDINGDGKPDLIINSIGDTISVLLNTTDPGATVPSFGSPQSLRVGLLPDSIALGDVNGDGKPDIVVANRGSDNVSVLLNTTDPGATTPGFALQQTFATGGEPNSVVLGDINCDGKPDVVVANLDSSSVSVLLDTTAPGATAPSFAVQQTFATGSYPYSMALGDVNGDGKPDIVATGSSLASVLLDTTAPGAAVLSFAPRQDFAVGTSHNSVALGDVNGDGKPDIVVANQGSNNVSVLLNTTAAGVAMPGFADQQTFTTTRPISLALGDFNGDGKPDVVVANAFAGAVSVLLNTTNVPLFLTRGTANGTIRDNDPAYLAIAAGDDQSSYVGTSYGIPLAVLVSNAAGIPASGIAVTFTAPNSGPGGTFTGGSTTAVAVSDATGTATAPVLTADTSAGAFTVTASVGSSVGTFHLTNLVIPGPSYLSVSDPAPMLEGDTGTTGLVFVVTRSGDTSTAQSVDYTTADGTAHAGVDYVATSGTLDFAVGQTTATVTVPVNSNTVPQPDRTLSLILTNPSSPAASFAPRQTFTTNSKPYSVAVGDVNGDGKPDLVAGIHGMLSVLLNTTTPGSTAPSFAAPQTFLAGDPHSVVLGDVNGDGRPDIIFATYLGNSVSVLLNTTAPGSMTTGFSGGAFATNNGPNSVVLGDINGDGRPDIVVASHDFTNTTLLPESVSVLLNTTPAGATVPSFAPAQTISQGSSPRSVAVGDINGDGKPDIVIGFRNFDQVAVAVNTTASGATAPSFDTYGVIMRTPGSVAVGDVNGDGKLDLIAITLNNTVTVAVNTTAVGATAPSFAAPQVFATGDGPSSVALGDVNGDGRPDIVVANASSNSVSLLLNATAAGATSASFLVQQTFATGSAPNSMALGDLDGDGTPDIVVSDADSNSLLLNTTSVPLFLTRGTATGTIRDDDALLAVAAGDGQSTYIGTPFAMPLAVSVTDAAGTPQPGITVTFTAPNSGPGGMFANGSTTGVAISNANGIASIVLAANSAIGPFTVTASVGKSIVSFHLSSLATPALFVSDPAPVFEGDSGTTSLVFVVTRSGDTSQVQSVNYATADDTARAGVDYQPKSGTLTFAVGQTTATVVVPVIGNTMPQFDRTLKLNLSLANPSSQAASFGPQQTFAAGSGPSSVATGDVNGDGKPDVVVVNQGSNNVSVLLDTTPAGAAAFTFAVQQTFAAGTGPASVALGDVNGDGKPDIIVTNYSSSSVSVLLNTTPAGATPPSFAGRQAFATGHGPSSMALSDFNGDGKPDIVVTNTNSNTVSVLINTTPAGASTPSYAAPQAFVIQTANPPYGNPISVAVGDGNGDGKPDIFVPFDSGRFDGLSVLVNTTAAGAIIPSFANPAIVGDGSSTVSVAVGDVNGDGKPDIIEASRLSFSFFPRVTVCINSTPAGSNALSFPVYSTFSTNGITNTVALGDVNGDGRPDILVDATTVLINLTPKGATTPSYAAPQAFSGSSGSVALADINGDGKPELVIPNAGSNNVSVLPNTVGSSLFLTRSTAIGTIRDDDSPAALAIFSGDRQFGSPGTPFTTPLAVTVTDANGHPVQGVLVTFTAPATGPGGTFPGGAATAVAVTNASGIATAPALTANSTVGPFTVTAAVNGLLSMRTFSLWTGMSFDFGTSGSPLATGATQVTATTAYSTAQGYGWAAGVIADADRGFGTDATRDLNYTADGTFWVDLPNGTYRVTLTLGDTAGALHDNMGVFFQGTQADSVSTNPGQVVTNTYTVSVTGGRLVLRLADQGGSDPNAAIEELSILLDRAGPSVVSSTPTGTVFGLIDHIDVVFGEPILGSSFTPSQATLTGPGGPVAVSSVTPLNATTYRVSFAAQSTLGSYSLTIGTGVTDLAGNPMNQNGNAVNGEAGVDAYTTSVTLKGAPTSYDFGTSGSPLAAGDTRVTATTAYSAAQGYGWAAGAIADADRGVGTDATRDLNYTTDGTFWVDLPNGTYRVSLTMGDLGGAAHDNIGVFLQGAQVDSVSTSPGQVVTRSYTVTVRGGRLVLRLVDLGKIDPFPSGSDPFAAIEALTIAANPTFDFGTSGSPLATGDTRVTATTAYSAAQGYGWAAGLIAEADRGMGTDATRDLNYTHDGTFWVDLPNGIYRVSLTLGDTAGALHDDMGLFLQGAQVDSVSTRAGQVVTNTCTVTVTGGRLVLRLADQGGSDPFAAIEELMIR